MITTLTALARTGMDFLKNDQPQNSPRWFELRMNSEAHYSLIMYSEAEPKDGFTKIAEVSQQLIEYTPFRTKRILPSTEFSEWAILF